MQNSSVSFTSTLRPTSLVEFAREVAVIPSKNNITNWTAKQVVKDKDAFTRGVIDCTVCGITDGKAVVLTHICPTKSENADFLSIEEAITEKIDMESPDLQGILFGSDALFNDSKKLFNKFQKFMQKNKISYSMFRGHNDISTNTSVAYKTCKDEWIFTNDFIDANINKKSAKKTILAKAFDEIRISDKDEFVI